MAHLKNFLSILIGFAPIMLLKYTFWNEDEIVGISIRMHLSMMLKDKPNISLCKRSFVR